MTKKKPPKKGGKKPKAGNSKDAARKRRLAFVEAYIANGGNATDAAKQAGYSAKTAYSAGGRALKHVETARMIAERQKKLQEAHGLTTDRVIQELSRIAFADLRKVFDDKGALLPPNLWPDDVAAAMAGVDVVEMAGGMEVSGESGISHVPMYTKKVKLWDKNAAIEKAMKHLGMFEKDNAQAKTQFVVLDAADQRA